MENVRAKAGAGGADDRWEEFHLEKTVQNYPRWPNESLLKVVFGNYLKRKLDIRSDSKVLDIGCGFGNNLLPFLDMGCQCFGIEVTEAMAAKTQELLAERGYRATIRKGSNRELPFEDSFFDLCLSVNVLHYEKDEVSLKAGLSEYCRVLKPGGALFLVTVGPEHVIYQRAKVVGPHQFEIQNFDFRNGEVYFYFSNQKYLEYYLTPFWSDIELGRVTERLMTKDLDCFLAVCRNKKSEVL